MKWAIQNAMPPIFLQKLASRPSSSMTPQTTTVLGNLMHLFRIPLEALAARALHWQPPVPLHRRLYFVTALECRLRLDPALLRNTRSQTAWR